MPSPRSRSRPARLAPTARTGGDRTGQRSSPSRSCRRWLLGSARTGTATVASGRAGGTAGLLLVALALFLLAPHAAPALEQAGLGAVLRRATGRLPGVPELGRPQGGGPAAPVARRAVAFALAQRGK